LAMSHSHHWESNFEYELGRHGVLPDAGNPLIPYSRLNAASGFQESARSFNPAPFSQPMNGIATQVSTIDHAAVVRFAQQNRLVVIDNTAKINGALWVIHKKANDAIAHQLQAYGMKYAESRGWWMN
jgi:hypothetical protein